MGVSNRNKAYIEVIPLLNLFNLNQKARIRNCLSLEMNLMGYYFLILDEKTKLFKI